MLTTIHTITDAIVIRKNRKWKNCFLTDDKKVDCNNIFESMQSLLNKHFRKLSKNRKETDLATNCIKNVYSIKSRLQESEWPLPCSLSQNEQKVYLHDLNFYLMLCGILTKATTLFKGYFAAKDRLSYAQTLPVIQGNTRRIVQTINLLPHTRWVDSIQMEQPKNKFLNSLERLDQRISVLDPSSTEYLFLSRYRSSIKKYPVNLEHEKHLVKIHYNMLQILDDFKNEESDKTLRELMYEGFKLGWIHKTSEKSYLEGFKNLNPDSTTIKGEIKKLKSLYKKCRSLILQQVIKSDRVTRHINDLITKLQQINTKDYTPNEYIEWTHSPKEFVKAMHTIISNGYINIKGSTDMKPIIEFINKFVKIRKQNNSGSLSSSSLLTYFKKTNSGDFL